MKFSELDKLIKKGLIDDYKITDYYNKIISFELYFYINSVKYCIRMHNIDLTYFNYNDFILIIQDEMEKCYSNYLTSIINS